MVGMLGLTPRLTGPNARRAIYTTFHNISIAAWAGIEPTSAASIGVYFPIYRLSYPLDDQARYSMAHRLLY